MRGLLNSFQGTRDTKFMFEVVIFLQTQLIFVIYRTRSQGMV